MKKITNKEKQYVYSFDDKDYFRGDNTVEKTLKLAKETHNDYEEEDKTYTVYIGELITYEETFEGIEKAIIDYINERVSNKFNSYMLGVCSLTYIEDEFKEEFSEELKNFMKEFMDLRDLDRFWYKVENVEKFSI